MFLLALIVIYIPKATFVIKLWLQKFRWVIEDLNPRTSDLETGTLPPPPPGSQNINKGESLTLFFFLSAILAIPIATVKVEVTIISFCLFN